MGTKPGLGRNPTTPQKAAGILSEPPRSVPSAKAIWPVMRSRGAAAGRAAGRPFRVPRVPRGAEDLVEGVAAGGELGGVGLSQNHRAGGPEPGDHQRVFLGHVVGVERRPVGGAQAADLGNVFDADRQAVQQP